MSEVLLSIARLAMFVFLLTTMLGIGFSLKLSQIIAPLRSVRLLTSALMANFVVAPLLAVGVVKLFRLDEPFAIGLLLLGLAPGAPFLPKLAELAKGDLGFSVALMVLLMAGTVVFLPIALPQVMPGVKVGMWQIARPLLLLMVLPLIGGLVFKARFRSLTGLLRSGLSCASNISLLIVTVLVVALNLPSVLRVIGTGAIAAGILFTALAGLAGHLLGGSDIATRKVMALGTGFRNIAAALVVGEEDFRDPRVIVMLVIAGLVGLFLLLPITLAWGKRPTVHPPPHIMIGHQDQP
jgi:BASS family bile acid:Na+ symporter